MTTVTTMRLPWLIALLFAAFHSTVFAQNYEYQDGSANLYKLAPGTLEYVPVTRAQSSSGLYSGGSPATVTLQDAQYQSLLRLFDQAIAAKAFQTDQRVKLSGLVRKQDPSAERTVEVILKPNAAVKTRIEKTLRKLVKPTCAATGPC